MKRILNWLGLLLFVSASIYFVLFAFEHAASVISTGWTPENYKVLFYAAIIYCAVPVIGSGVWAVFMLSTGESATASKIMKIFLLSQLAKYLPGNIMHHLGRIALARRYHLGVSRTAFTMILETGMTILAGTFLSAMSFLYAGEFLFRKPYPMGTNWHLGALVLAGFFLLWVGAWIVKHWRPRLVSAFIDDRRITVPRIGVLTLCFVLYLLSFVLMGGIVFMLLSGIYDVAEPPFWRITGIFAAAWVAGFVTPGAPAGFGVREAILIALLKPLYGGGVVLGVTIALRVVTLIGDGLVFVAALVSSRHDVSRVPSC